MESKKLFINLLFLLFFLIPVLFSQEVFSKGITWENLSSHSLNQLVSGIYKKPKKVTQRNLMVDQDPEIKGKCATPIIRMALTHQDRLDEENRFILYRPDDPSYVRYYTPDGSVPWIYDTPEGHFKIHYSETGIHAVFGSDANQSTIPDYVVSFGSYFEQAWNYLTDQNKFGYNPPPPDGNNGGDSRFDVYIKNISYYGYTQVEDGHPYIVVHTDYIGDFEPNLDPEGSRAGNMKITAAHEFFHAVQYFYDDWNDDCIWWEENTAVWMEDEVFDNVDGYLNYLGNRFDDLNGNLIWDSGETWYEYNGNPVSTSEREEKVWFEFPHLPLDTMFSSVFDRYEYGGVMWAKYLAARFGDEFIKDSFIITDYNTNALTAVQQALLDYGSSIQEAFYDFRIKVLTLDQNIFEEGESYPLVRHEGNYGDYPVNLNLVEDISHLSCRYIGLKAPVGEMKLVIEVDGQDYSNFGVALVLFKDVGYEVRDIPIGNWEQTGRINVISFGTEGLYKRATIIPLNLSAYQDKRSLTIVIKENSPPEGLSVQLTPDPAYMNEELLCTASGVYDADGDTISYKYIWKKNGVIDKETDFVENKTTDTLDKNKTSQGDTWSCEVTVKDTSDDQDSVTSNNVFIDNRKPTIDTIPDGPHVWSEMGYHIIQIIASDPDGNDFTLEIDTNYVDPTDPEVKDWLKLDANYNIIANLPPESSSLDLKYGKGILKFNFIVKETNGTPNLRVEKLVTVILSIPEKIVDDFEYDENAPSSGNNGWYKLQGSGEILLTQEDLNDPNSNHYLKTNIIGSPSNNRQLNHIIYKTFPGNVFNNSYPMIQFSISDKNLYYFDVFVRAKNDEGFEDNYFIRYIPKNTNDMEPTYKVSGNYVIYNIGDKSIDPNGTEITEVNRNMDEDLYNATSFHYLNLKGIVLRGDIDYIDDIKVFSASTIDPPQPKVPLDPIELKAILKDSMIELTWRNDPDQHPDLAGYMVYYCHCDDSFCNGCYGEMINADKADTNGLFIHYISKDVYQEPLQIGNTYYFTVKAMDTAEPANFSDGRNVSITFTLPATKVIDNFDFGYETDDSLLKKGWYRLQGRGSFLRKAGNGFNHYLELKSYYTGASELGYIIMKWLKDPADFTNHNLTVRVRSLGNFRIDAYVKGKDGKNYFLSYKGDIDSEQDSFSATMVEKRWSIYTIGWKNKASSTEWYYIDRNLNEDLFNAKGVQFDMLLGVLLRGTLDIDNIEIGEGIHDAENLTARPGDTSVLLSWTLVDPNKSDETRIYKDDDFETTLTPSSDKNNYQYEVTGLTTGTSYEFKVVQVVEGIESNGVSIEVAPMQYKAAFTFDDQSDLDKWSLLQVREGDTFDVLYDSDVQSNVMYLNPAGAYPDRYYVAKEVNEGNVTGMTCRIKTNYNFVIWLDIEDTSMPAGHSFMLGFVPGGKAGTYSLFGNFAYYFLGPGLTDGKWHLFDFKLEELMCNIFTGIVTVKVNDIYFGGRIYLDDVSIY